MMTKENAELPKRKRNRLENFDYSSNGAYFVTICTECRQKVLCEILEDGVAALSPSGIVARKVICEIQGKYPCVRVDKYVVMPNHIHLIIMIDGVDGTGDPSPALGNIIGWYKYQATKQINMRDGRFGKRVFQRSFHDHIIRGEKDYQKIWNYIDGNPAKWKEDCFYVE